MCRQLYIVLLFCASCTYLHAQTSLIINVVDSATNEKMVLSRLELTKDSLTKFIDRYSLQSEFLIDQIDTGKWTIRYDSYFFNFKEVEVNLISDKQNTFTICIRSIKANPKKPLLLDQLKENDSLSFILTSNGCFHSWEDTLKIVVHNGKKTVYYKNKSKGLDATHFAVLRQFEAQLHLIKDNGCTTVGTYHIIYKGKKSQKYFDGSCSWDFGERIISYLFPNPLDNPHLSITEE